MIVARTPAAQIATLAATQGMRTLTQDGIRKIFKAQIDLKQLRAVTVV